MNQIPFPLKTATGIPVVSQVTGKVLPMALPPEAACGELAPSDRIELAIQRERIERMAELESQWVVVSGHQPDANRLIDYDFMLLVVVEAWLGALPRVDEGDSQASDIWVDVRSTVAELSLIHPARAHLCGLDGKLFTPAPAWPTYHHKRSIIRKRSTAEVMETQLKVVLHRLRRMHASGYLVLRRIDHGAILKSGYEVRPSLRGLARGVHLAARIGYHLAWPGDQL